MEFQIKEIELIPEILKSIEELKAAVTGSELSKRWYTLEETWQLKGGCTLATFQNRRYFQCKGGIPDAKVNGRRVWSKESVFEWINITDDQLEAYHEKYRTGAKNHEVKKN